MAWAQPAALLDILAAELERNLAELKQKADPAPYFLAYNVVEEESYQVSGGFGAIRSSTSNKARFLDVTLRLGSHQFDNYHRMRGDLPRFSAGVALPIEDDPNPIRRRIWLETDRIYRLASQRLIRLRTDAQLKAAEDDPSDDFSKETAARFVQSPPPLAFAREVWEQRVRRWSSECNKHHGVLACNVTLSAGREVKYLVNSEGTRLQHGRNFVRVSINARGKAADGMDLSSSDSFEAESLEGLPREDVVAAATAKVCARITQLLRAPPVDPFVGPAILSGSAAGVFFHEIFGHRIEGHRQKDESEGQTFTKSLGKAVLPEFLSVIFDPTRRSIAGQSLNGWYRFDDEGVAARPVTVVDKGVLKNFLMSRSPIRGFANSNGHGRRQPGAEVVSRQSNLIVESARQVPKARLRELLIEEITKQQKPYGLLFEQVTGGFTTTGRQGLQAFSVLPLVVYRVYADGRPDELVRGVSIVGTPLASFSKIAATSDTLEVFNGVCGAESGNVPVAAVAPALLVTEIEVQRSPVGSDSPPALPRPVPTSGGGF